MSMTNRLLDRAERAVVENEARVRSGHVQVILALLRDPERFTSMNQSARGLRTLFLRARERQVLESRHDTTTSVVIGTPYAMAPEQLLGTGVDRRTDVYAVGVLAFHLVVGRPPFNPPSLTEMEEMHLEAAPPRASQHVRVSPAYDAFVARAMRKAPAERFADMQEVIRALDLIQEAAPLATISVRVNVDASSSADALERADAVLTRASSVGEQAGWTLELEAGNELVFRCPCVDVDTLGDALRRALVDVGEHDIEVAVPLSAG
jgi:serine/threonine protein kinase